MPTIPEALVRAAETFGDAEAVVDGDVRLSWRELLDEVRTAARFYIASGVEPGDRVAVWAPNTHHWVIAALGAHYAGATLVPVNTRFTGHEARDILLRTRAVALVVADEFLGTDRLAQLRAAGPTPELRTVLQVPSEWADLAARAGPVPVPEADTRAAAVRDDRPVEGRAVGPPAGG